MMYSLGVIYLQLQQLINDNASRITAERPLKIRLMRRKGKRALRCSIGKAWAWVELPEDLDAAMKLAKSAVEMFTEQVKYVEYEQAS